MRYGYVWVCLGEPIDDIPDLAYEDDLAFRRIHQFDELWRCSALRMMENSFDNAHFAFVHKGTFGDIDQPKPEKYELTETYYGFVAETIVPVRNPPQAARITGTSEPWTKRKMRNAWFMPFCRTMDMEYPSGLRHIIFNSATPVDDGSIQLIQILYRNDREEDCSTEELIAWDRAIIEEDRDILESTDPDAIVDMGRKLEMHMPSDRPGDADAQAPQRAARGAWGARGSALSAIAGRRTKICLFALGPICRERRYLLALAHSGAIARQTCAASAEEGDMIIRNAIAPAATALFFHRRAGRRRTLHRPDLPGRPCGRKAPGRRRRKRAPGPQSSFATMHRQPTPGTVASAEEKAGNLSPAQVQAITEDLDAARDADDKGDSAACEKALNEAEPMLHR